VGRHTQSFAVLGLSVVVSACGNPNELGHVRASVVGDMTHASVPFAAYDLALDDACDRGGPNALGRQNMPRWPYLQKVTRSGAEILFTSTREEDFVVDITRPNGEVVKSVKAREDAEASQKYATLGPGHGTQYVAALDELPEAELLCYQVRAGEEAWTTPTGFRLAPNPDAEAPVRFAALGDLGKRTSDQFAVYEQMKKVPVDFVLLTGDIAYDNGKLSEFEQNVFGVYQSMMTKVPFFAASGNHDYNTDDANAFRNVFALFENGGEVGLERWYSFDWGPVHFVVLDTEKYFEEQQAWLKTDLTAHDRPWTIAVLHRPPYSAGSHGSEHAVREAFSPILAEHGVALVLAGHEHDYERTHPQDGVVYVVTGGGGRGTRAVGEEDFTAVSDRVAHFTWIEADARELRMVAIDATGQPFDSMRLQARDP
jgi:predicted phosphodiesterase